MTFGPPQASRLLASSSSSSGDPWPGFSISGTPFGIGSTDEESSESRRWEWPWRPLFSSSLLPFFLPELCWRRPTSACRRPGPLRCYIPNALPSRIAGHPAEERVRWTDASDWMSEFIVRRRFPFYDLVVRTPLSRDEVISSLSASIQQPISRLRFRFGSDEGLYGHVEHDSFLCHPGTSAFGGNTWSSIRGTVVPRAEGGTDISLRITNWFAVLFPSVFILLSLWFAAASADTSDRIKSLAMATWLAIASVGLYAAEIAFARSIIERMFPQT